MSKKLICRKIKDIVISEERQEVFPTDRTFVEEVHFLRDHFASRLNAMTTGFVNLAESHKIEFGVKESLQIEIVCIGVEDSWFLVIERDGTIAFEQKRRRDLPYTNRFAIEGNWTDKQILDFEMPADLVIEHLLRSRWITECLHGVLHEVETKMADALAKAADKELKQANEARREMNSALKDLETERERLRECRAAKK